MALAAVGLGSNLGDRMQHLARAARALTVVGTLVGRSSVYETAPVGGPVQGSFLNAVVVIETARSPITLLRDLLAIERIEGRERRERWGPRTLDLDILLCGREAVDIPGLTVPHPRIQERRFVVEPLLEAWPEARLPDGAPPALVPEATTQAVERLPNPEAWLGPRLATTAGNGEVGLSGQPVG
jgi:2-amino-4-hydroxy-6-hydroxymethyldihydropteridine diphosphokinase